MENESSLVIFERAALMLAEANTIQQAKELKNLALTAADWAKHKGMGEAAFQHCRAYALEAERKMGQMLEATERAKPPNPKPPKDRRSHDVTDDTPPTLADLGLSKNESSKAQMLADLPQEAFNAVRDGEKTLAQVKKEIKANATPPAYGPPPTPPAQEKDPNGKAIPTKLLALWRRRQEIQDICTQISRIRTTIMDAGEQKDLLYAELHHQSVKAHLDQAYTEIKATMPYCLCPSCQGEGCRACAHRGLIGKFRYDMTIPEELKR